MKDYVKPMEGELMQDVFKRIVDEANKIFSEIDTLKILYIKEINKLKSEKKKMGRSSKVERRTMATKVSGSTPDAPTK